MHNTSQPLLDHGVYYANTVQVVEPTARHLLGPDFPTARPPSTTSSNRLAVIDKKSLGLNIIAAARSSPRCCPGCPGVSAFFAWLITTVAGAIGSAHRSSSPELDGSAASASVAFLIDDDADPARLTVIGWVIASALLAALLIWLNQLHAEADRALDRLGPLPARRADVARAHRGPAVRSTCSARPWCAVVRHPRRWEPQPDAAWLAIERGAPRDRRGVRLRRAAVLARRPRVVPEQRDARRPPTTVLPPTERMRLGDRDRERASTSRSSPPAGARLDPDGRWRRGGRSTSTAGAPVSSRPRPDTTVIELSRGPRRAGGARVGRTTSRRVPARRAPRRSPRSGGTARARRGAARSAARARRSSR